MCPPPLPTSMAKLVESYLGTIVDHNLSFEANTVQKPTSVYIFINLRSFHVTTFLFIESVLSPVWVTFFKKQSELHC